MTTGRPIVDNPYPGLRSFRPEESYLFFGRDRHVREMRRRLLRSRLLAVVGSSGCGKSSLVHAGLLPAIQGSISPGIGMDWRMLTIQPGGQPIRRLAAELVRQGVCPARADDAPDLPVQRALATLDRSSHGLVHAVSEGRALRGGGGYRVLVFVDQFEELFRFAREVTPDAAQAFVRLLLQAIGQERVPVYVVLTMRSDFLGHCAGFPGLPEAIDAGQYLVPRLERDEIREAILGPAAVAGTTLTGRLVNRLLNEVGNEPDHLPLLQHALRRTWELWQQHLPDARELDLEDYTRADIESLAVALDRHAEETFRGLASAEERRIAEVLFRTVTAKGPDNQGMRRPQPLGMIADVAGSGREEVVRVIEAFRRPDRAFLTPALERVLQLAPEDYIDITHESLMRHWRRLQDWLDSEAMDVGWLAELEKRRVRKEPLVGLSLASGIEWRTRRRQLQGPGGQRASPTALERWAELAGIGWSAIDRYLTQRVRWKRARDGAKLGVVLVVAAMAVYAQVQRQKFAHRTVELQATNQVLETTWRQLQATNEALRIREGELGEANTNLWLAVDRLSLTSNDLAQSLTVQTNLAAKTNELAQALQRQVDEAVRARDVAMKAQTDAEAETSRRRATLFESYLSSASLLALNEQYGRAAQALRASADSELEAAAANRLRARDPVAWRVNDLAVGPEHTDTNSMVPWLCLAVSADGKYVAFGGEQGQVRLFTLAGGRPLANLRGLARKVPRILFDPLNRWILGVDEDRQLAFWSLADALADADRRPGSPDVDGGARGPSPPVAPADVLRTEGEIQALAIAPGGTWIAWGGPDGGPVLFRMGNRRAATARIELESRTALAGAPHVTDLAFSPGGQYLAATSEDGAVRLWDLGDSTASDRLRVRPARVLTQQSEKLYRLAFDPAGECLAVSGEGSDVQVWAVPGTALWERSSEGERVRPIQVLRGHRGVVLGLCFPSATNLVTASTDQTLRVWDLTTGATLKVLEGHTASVTDVATSGGVLVSASVDMSWRTWTPGPSACWRLPLTPGSTPTCVALAPDAAAVAVGFRDGTVRCLALPDGADLWGGPRRGHATNVTALVFSSVSDRLASASEDGTLQYWDRESGPVGEQIVAGAGGVDALAFSRDGKWLAVGSLTSEMLLAVEGELRVGTDPPSGRITLLPDGHTEGPVLRGHQGPLLALAFGPVRGDPRDPDYELLSTGEDRVTLHWPLGRLADLESRQVKPSHLFHRTNYPGRIYAACAMSSDGQWAALVGRPGLVTVFGLGGDGQARRAETVTELSGHEDTVYRARFGPDDAYLLTLSSDGTIRAWDRQSWVREEGEQGGRSRDPPRELLVLPLPLSEAARKELRDFDVVTAPGGPGWLAVPDADGALLLYRLDGSTPR